MRRRHFARAQPGRASTNHSHSFRRGATRIHKLLSFVDAGVATLPPTVTLPWLYLTNPIELWLGMNVFLPGPCGNRLVAAIVSLVAFTECCAGAGTPYRLCSEPPAPVDLPARVGLDSLGHDAKAE